MINKEKKPNHGTVRDFPYRGFMVLHDDHKSCLYDVVMATAPCDTCCYGGSHLQPCEEGDFTDGESRRCCHLCTCCVNEEIPAWRRISLQVQLPVPTDTQEITNLKWALHSESYRFGHNFWGFKNQVLWSDSRVKVLWMVGKFYPFTQEVNTYVTTIIPALVCTCVHKMFSA